MTSGSYPDDGLGEVFLKLGKQGIDAGRGDGCVLDCGVDRTSVRRAAGDVRAEVHQLKFEPAGPTDDPDIRMAQSIMDYIFLRLALDYLSFDERSELGIYNGRARVTSRQAHIWNRLEEISEAQSLKNDRGDLVATDQMGADLDTDRLDEPVASAKPAPPGARTSSELFEEITGTSVDALLPHLRHQDASKR